MANSKALSDKEYEVSKFRSMEFLMYPESMIDDWLDVLPTITDAEIALGVHDFLEKTSSKVHVHCLLHFNNPRTIKVTYENLNRRLSKDGLTACANPTIDCIVNNFKHAYDYLLHDTDDARKKGKHQYPIENRILLNNFDIGHIIQLSSSDKLEIRNELRKIIKQYGFQYADEALDWIDENESVEYSNVAQNDYGFITMLCNCNRNRIKDLNYAEHNKIVEQQALIIDKLMDIVNVKSN